MGQSTLDSLQLALLDEERLPLPQTRQIGRIGSFMLAFNCLLGPGLLDLPAVFQKAGWLPLTSALICVGLVSGLAVTTLCESMERIPHIGARRPRREYSDVFGYAFGARGFGATQVLFYLCNLSQVVAAIVATSQVVDQLVMFLHGHTYAVQLSALLSLEGPGRALLAWKDADCPASKPQCMPFSTAKEPTVLTLGCALTAVALGPLGFLSLEENIWVQGASFVLTLLLIGYFLLCWLLAGPFPEPLPMVGTDVSNVLGVAVFNFALAMAVPSWVNEKAAAVSVNRTVWPATVASLAIYVGMGVAGACSMRLVADNMLQSLGANNQPVASRLAAFAFGISIIGLGVPVTCVVMRNNLEVGRVLSRRGALFASAVLPYLLSWTLYRGHRALDVISWTGMIFNGAVNLVLPLLLALALAAPLWLARARGDGTVPDFLSVADGGVHPLPACLEPARPRLLCALLALSIPAILMATGLKTVVGMHTNEDPQHVDGPPDPGGIPAGAGFYVPGLSSALHGPPWQGLSR